MGTKNNLPNGSWSNRTKYLLIGLVIAFFGWLLHSFYIADQDLRANRIGTLLSLMALSFALTYLLLLLIVSVFGFSNFKKGLLNFLIGETGTYSLSRLQAVLWAVVIISDQFGIIICLLFNRHGMYFKYYEPIFSESAIMLLGLSLTGYIAVKGITVNNMANARFGLVREKVVPKWGDIVTGPNGLDFSKCQMLIWTLIAVGVYLSKCYYFDSYMISQPSGTVIKLMGNMFDEYNSRQSLAGNFPYVPYLPYSFVVLMGISQGVYVGKKLVPSFKLDDLKVNKQNDLQSLVTNLKTKQDQLAAILRNTSTTDGSSVDRVSIASINNNIRETQDAINAANGDINQINEYLNSNR